MDPVKSFTLRVERPEGMPNGIAIHAEYSRDLVDADRADPLVLIGQILIRLINDMVQSTDTPPDRLKYSTADGQEYDSALGGFINPQKGVS